MLITSDKDKGEDKKEIETPRVMDHYDTNMSNKSKDK